MTVKIARNSGFCFGVKRAIKVALSAAERYTSLVSLGPLIHNPQMVDKLREQGIISVNNVDEIDDTPVIIRSHGVEKCILDYLIGCKKIIIDATCPFVAKAQGYVKRLCEEGCPVLIFGDRNHPEVIALKSYGDKTTAVVGLHEELPKTLPQRVSIISQTTQNLINFQHVIDKLTATCKDVRVINTICSATSVRQASTLALAKESDVMIVIGGKNSSNTKMLAMICKEHAVTYHIETAEELDTYQLADQERIGLTAGASTPDWVILGVYNKIINSKGDRHEIVYNVEDIPGYKEEPRC